MGYSLTPVAVNLQQVAGLIGSREGRLVDAIVERFGPDFGEIDRMAADHAEDIEAEAATTVRDALARMLNGEPYDEDFGFVYGYALEFLCLHVGEALTNGEWSAMRSEWADLADEALWSLGVDESVLRLGHLMHRGSPIPLPEIEDFPAIGYLRGPEIRAALASFEEAKLASVADDELRDSLAELRGWLEHCEAGGRDLVCFYA